MKPWPRQLLNNRIDYHEETKEDDPKYLAKMVRLTFLQNAYDQLSVSKTIFVRKKMILYSLILTGKVAGYV